MKQFEHEVLSFDTSTTKGFAKMQQELQEWGKAGFEIVSAVSGTVSGDIIRIFMKREILEVQGVIEGMKG